MVKSWHRAMLLLVAAWPAIAQKQELGLTLGGTFGTDRATAANIPFRLGPGLDLNADYEYRVIKGGPLALYAGVHFLADAQRKVSSSDFRLTRDVATIYAAPGLMLKFLPGARATPWLAAGGGIAVYEQSTSRLDGAANGASREVVHGAFMVGGGVDIPMFRFVAVRAEIREFYTGNPSYNTVLPSGQNNVTAGGGVVIRFGH